MAATRHLIGPATIGQMRHGAILLNFSREGVADEAAVVSGLQALGWGVQGGARFRIDAAPAVRITVSGLMPRRAPLVADALAAVLSGRAVSA